MLALVTAASRASARGSSGPAIQSAKRIRPRQAARTVDVRLDVGDHDVREPHEVEHHGHRVSIGIGLQLRDAVEHETVEARPVES